MALLQIFIKKMHLLQQDNFIFKWQEICLLRLFDHCQQHLQKITAQKL